MPLQFKNCIATQLMQTVLSFLVFSDSTENFATFALTKVPFQTSRAKHTISPERLDIL